MLLCHLDVIMCGVWFSGALIMLLMFVINRDHFLLIMVHFQVTEDQCRTIFKEVVEISSKLADLVTQQLKQ